MLYIDFAKAYDSVEFWGLQQVLRAYGFDDRTRNLIKEMTEGFKMQIKTEYMTTHANRAPSSYQGLRITRAQMKTYPKKLGCCTKSTRPAGQVERATGEG